MIIRLGLEVQENTKGIQSTVTGLEKLEKQAERTKGRLKETTNGVGEFSNALGRTTTTLARSADVFGLSANSMRALGDVADVAEMGFGKLTKAAAGFNATSIGVAGAGFAIGTMIGGWLRQIPAVEKAADSAAAALYRMFTGRNTDVSKATAGLKEFSAAMAKSNEEAQRKQVAAMRAAGTSDKDIVKFYGKRLDEDVAKELGLTEKAMKAREEGEKKVKKLQEETLGVTREYNKAIASIVKGRDDEKELLADIDRQVEELLAKQLKLEDERVASLKEGRLREGDMLFGDSGLWTRETDVISEELQRAATIQQEAAEASDTWASRLAVVADITTVMGGTLGNMFSKLTGGVMSFLAASEQIVRIQGKGLGGLFGGGLTWTEKLGNLGAIGGMASSVIGIGKTLWGGIKSLFGGKSDEEKAREKAEKDAQQAIRDDIGGSFGQLAASTEYASAGFLQVLDAARGTKEATAWIAQNLDKAAGGVKKMADGMKYLTDKGAAAVGSMVFSTIEKDVALRGIGAAAGHADSYQKTLTDLQARGVDTSAMGADRAGRLIDLGTNEAVVGLSGVARGMGDAVQGLLNAGAIDTNYLRDSSVAAQATVDELRNQGLSNREVYTEMASYLNAARASYAALGQQVPEEIQKMIEESEAAGVMIVGDQGIGKTNRLLEQILGALGHSYSPYGSGGGAPTPTDGFDDGGWPEDGPGRRDYSAARGWRPRKLGRDTVFLAHRGERVAILPEHVQMMSAARGYYENDDRERRGGGGTLLGGDTSVGDVPVSGGGGTSTTVSVATAAAVAAVQATLAPIVESAVQRSAAPTVTVPVTYAPQVEIRDDSVVRTPEAVRAMENVITGALMSALESNSRGVRAGVKQVVTEVLRENGVI